MASLYDDIIEYGAVSVDDCTSGLLASLYTDNIRLMLLSLLLLVLLLLHSIRTHRSFQRCAGVGIPTHEMQAGP